MARVTSAYLVRQAQDGDEQAFDRLFCAVQPGLLRYLRVLVGHDAEDVASEAWLCIVRDLSSFTGDDAAFRGWAATIARHRAVDHLRHRDRRPAASAPAEELAEMAAAEDTEALALDAISTDAAVRLIATLPPDQAEAVMLRAVLGLDAKTAGRVLGKRPGAVRTAAYRGLQRLAELAEPARQRPAERRREPAPQDQPARPSAAASAVTSGNRSRVTHSAAATVKEAR
jgi:RNA polymerase sigma-70 factor (ECF subfamily)